MKTVKANYSQRRADIMKQLGLTFTIEGSKMVHKTNSGKSLVHILVDQEVINRKAGMYPGEN